MDIFSMVFGLMRLFLDVSWEMVDARHQAKTDVLQELDNTTNCRQSTRLYML